VDVLKVEMQSWCRLYHGGERSGVKAGRWLMTLMMPGLMVSCGCLFLCLNGGSRLDGSNDSMEGGTLRKLPVSDCRLRVCHGDMERSNDSMNVIDAMMVIDGLVV
jgi:hypothetical protein